MTRKYADFIEGTITTDPLLIGGTSIAAAVFEFLPTIASPHTCRLVLDPERVDGEPEIVIVTAHSAAATTVTVTRAADGTTAREHAMGTKVVLSLVTSDVVDLQSSPSVVIKRYQDAIGTDFDPREVTIPVTITIPSDWNTYDVEVYEQHQLLSFEATVHYYNLTKIYWGAVIDGLVMNNFGLEWYIGTVTDHSSVPSMNFTPTNIAYREGITGTGAKTVNIVTEIESNDTSLEISKITVIVKAYRVT